MMTKKTGLTLLAVLLFAGMEFGTNPLASAKTDPSTYGRTPDVLVGAAASPAMGMGNGNLLIDSTRTKQMTEVNLASGANAFQVAISGTTAYVPTLQGTTYIVDLQTKQVVTQFSSPKGARIAAVARGAHLLVILGADSVTAYSIPSNKMVWQAAMGGNALAIVGERAYVSSNAAEMTTVLDLKNGKVLTQLPVGHVEDSVYDAQMHTLWLANWSNGDMTILDTKDNHVLKVIQESEGGGFSMSSMMTSMGGFMQLAVGPKGRHVYAASFSGNILVYNAKSVMFEKDIPVPIPMAKLSGIAIDPSGKYAYTTVESQKETVQVSLQTDKIVSTYPKLDSNRWFVMR